MQTSDFNKLGRMPEEQLKEMAEELNLKQYPMGYRAPTAEELDAIQDFKIAYKRQSPKASKREIRRAAERRFGMKIGNLK